VRTAINREPVQDRVALRTLNLDGDRQADLRVHGGASKAVYCENFTVDGLVQDLVHIGDRFVVGSAEVMATQPRLPCYKLGLRFETDEMVKRFLASRRTGFHLAVTREGHVRTGDEMAMSGREPGSVPVSWITPRYVKKTAAT
jgi:MOSC domain-containing protein YiiM